MEWSAASNYSLNWKALELQVQLKHSNLRVGPAQTLKLNLRTPVARSTHTGSTLTSNLKLNLNSRSAGPTLQRMPTWVECGACGHKDVDVGGFETCQSQQHMHLLEPGSEGGGGGAYPAVVLQLA
jgi:hypothetical protein